MKKGARNDAPRLRPHRGRVPRPAMIGVAPRPPARPATPRVPGVPDEDTLRLMSGLIDAEKLLQQLSRAEKAQLLQWIARDLGDAFPGIESASGVCGGDTVVVRTRIPVWLLEKARREGLREAEILSAYPSLRAEDLANACAYVRSHRTEIDEHLLGNDADDKA